MTQLTCGPREWSIVPGPYQSIYSTGYHSCSDMGVRKVYHFLTHHTYPLLYAFALPNLFPSLCHLPTQERTWKSPHGSASTAQSLAPGHKNPLSQRSERVVWLSCGISGSYSWKLAIVLWCLRSRRAYMCQDLDVNWRFCATWLPDSAYFWHS